MLLEHYPADKRHQHDAHARPNGVRDAYWDAPHDYAEKIKRHLADDCQQKNKMLFHNAFCLLITCYGKNIENKIRLKMRIG